MSDCPTPPTAASFLLDELPSRLSTPSPGPPSTTPAPADDATAQSAAFKKSLSRELKAAQKAERKAAAKAARPPTPEPVAKPLLFLPREWVEAEGLEKLEVEGRRTTFFTWNMLAQALVRKVAHYNSDIVVLQEVDRLEDHLPVLNKTHSHTSYIGYKDKKHGLLIAHKDSVFEKVGERGLRLDELPIVDSPTPSTSTSSSSPSPSLQPSTEDSISRPPSPTIHDESYDPTTPEAKLARRAAGLSRSTRNVALMVALKFKDREGGVLIATTHLFWHPQHVYERARQTGIVLRELRRFRDENEEWLSWPTFLAGDLNTQPRESTYRLVMGLPLTEAQIGDIARSTVVHQSVDKLHDKGYVAPPEDEAAKRKADAQGIHDGNLSQHPDRIITSARPGEDADGLIDLDALKELYGEVSGIRSAYGEAYGTIPSEEGRWYVDRPPEVASGSGWAVPEDPEVVKKRKQGTREECIRRGDFEPKWSNFTPLWRCTLDYIFLLPPSTLLPPPTKPQPRFAAVLRMHDDVTYGRGLPKMYVEPSDHVALATAVEIF
ncbi:hypothetical protein RQP46_001734 [Phenoliferia psychrophenolica]